MAGPASVAFSLKPGEISGPISNGNTGVVLSILDKQDPTPRISTPRKTRFAIRCCKTSNRKCSVCS